MIAFKDKTLDFLKNGCAGCIFNKRDRNCDKCWILKKDISGFVFGREGVDRPVNCPFEELQGDEHLQAENARLKADLALKDKMLDVAAGMAVDADDHGVWWHCPSRLLDKPREECPIDPMLADDDEECKPKRVKQCWKRYWEDKAKEMM